MAAPCSQDLGTFALISRHGKLLQSYSGSMDGPRHASQDVHRRANEETWHLHRVGDKLWSSKRM